jgi:uncharacterized protein YfbU (UPF0304 family)
MDRSVICHVTGKKYIFAQAYYDKKVEEYGDINNLRKYFVVKKVKSLIERGYNAQEIRNLLAVTDSGLLPVDCQQIKDIMAFHKVKVENISKRTSTNFATHKSDPDVATFINNIKKQSL